LQQFEGAWITRISLIPGVFINWVSLAVLGEEQQLDASVDPNE